MKKKSLKYWLRVNWDLCRQAVRSLRGNLCEICKSPFGIQIDHCFSRKVKQIFYDFSNLTILCESCHTKKSFNMQDMALVVFDHVKNREGLQEFNRLRQIAKYHKPFREWSLIAWQEDQFKKLSGLKQEKQ